jgi:hypothetical protein
MRRQLPTGLVRTVAIGCPAALFVWAAVVVAGPAASSEVNRASTVESASTTAALIAGNPLTAPQVAPATAKAAPGATASQPTITGPIQGGSHGYPFLSLQQVPSMPLSSAGYAEREYFMEGTAQSYAATGTWGSDGKWAVSPSTTAHYKTRLVVERPANPRRFNGTVVVEWVNVTAGVDIGADLAYTHEELLRRGYAYVGVSAQFVGVEGASGLKKWDPQRYGSLVHPGDAYSFDIFTQAATALRGPSSPLHGFRVKQLLADGESQSAMRMTTYANAIQPVTHAYDGFMIHSRFPAGVAVDAKVTPPTPSHIRDDLQVPVLQVQSETDLQLAGANTVASRQPDTARVHTWEVPGTSHIDGAFAEFTLTPLDRDAPTIPPAGCAKPVNFGQEHFVMNAALRSLSRWAAGGPAPASTPVITTAADGTIQRDADGNALGGIRTPAMDVPVATYNGSGNSPGLFCALLGTTTPFSQSKLAGLYPTHAAYVAKVTAAAFADVAKGYLLPEDASRLVEDAHVSSVGE